MTAVTARIGLAQRLALALAAALALLALALPVSAQENLDKGKSAAQLFASDCAICHKSPRGLGSKLGVTLRTFLREHYTASWETASTVAAYLQAIDRKSPPRERPSRRAAKPNPKAKPQLPTPTPDAAKPADGNAGAPATAPQPEAPKAEAAKSEAAKAEAPKADAAKPDTAAKDSAPEKTSE